MNHPSVLKRLQGLAGKAPKASANVRALARYAANSQCGLATLGFGSRVDFDRILRKTRYEAPYGQSPFALQRGNLFEDLLRQNGYASVFRLLYDHFGYPSYGRVADLRVPAGATPDHERRESETEKLIAKLIRQDREAPNLIDGAVLTANIGGRLQYFEADAVAARFEKPIHVGEVKSFPTVDGQADPEKVGSAVSQVAIYIVLLRRLVHKLGGDPKLVSTEALLITPRNTGMQPTLTVKAVGREVERAERILDQAPTVRALVGKLPPGLPTFAAIADVEARQSDRLAAVRWMIEAVGHKYAPACLATCGMSRLCRDLARERGDPAQVGGGLVRLLPNIHSLDRAAQLAAGGKARPEEEAAAQHLRRAARLRAQLTGEKGRRRTGARSSRAGRTSR